MIRRAVCGLVLGSATFACAQLPPEVAGAQAINEAYLRLVAPQARLFKTAGKVERVYGAPFSYGRNPVESASAFVSQYRELFTPDRGVFELEGTQEVMNGKFTAVNFRQTHDGLPVDRGYLTVLVRSEPEYPAVLASSGARLVSGKLGAATVGSKSAIAVARKAKPVLKVFTDPELVSYPGEARTYLAWRFVGDSNNFKKPERYEVFVDALSGVVLEWRNKIYNVDVLGNVEGRFTPGLKPDQPNNPTVMGPIPGIRVNITSGSTTFANSLGAFLLPNAGSTPVTVNSTLVGRWVRVANSVGSVLSLSQTVTPPGPANFTFNPSPTQLTTSQMNALLQTERVHNFAKSIIPTYPGIDVPLVANVNLVNTCNAFFNGSSINFYQAGGGCPNTAYSSVVWHEYGHFIISSGHPSAAGDYHEGMSDVTANLLGDTPWLAEDFFGQGTGPLRSAINNIRYPYSGDVHTGGQVISGAFWLTLLELDQTVGHTQGMALARSWYLNSILLRPAGINPAVTIDVLTLDDDDNNIFNGTPHYQEIATGFGAKNLDAPVLDWVTITPTLLPPYLVKTLNPARDETIRSELIRLLVTDNVGTLDPTTVRVWISVDGGAYNPTLRFVPLGGGQFRGAAPMPAGGHAARYYIEAKDTQGRPSYFPRGGQSSPIEVVVGNDLATMFEDTFTSNLGWSVSNTGLSTGAWFRDNPNGSYLNGAAANPENDSDDSGTFCFFTGQASPGAAVGTADVDGGPTRLRSPTINLAGSNAVIEYRRWYFNDDGDDAFTVEISNDGGATWRTVETVMYAGSENQWVFRRFAVSNVIAPTANVVLRFSAIDNPNNSITEAGVDHFVVRRIVPGG